jgi:hypothetical protein
VPAATPSPTARNAVASGAPAAPSAAPSAAIAAARTIAPEQRASALGLTDPLQLVLRSQMVTRVDGRVAGSVDFQQTLNSLKVRVGALVEVLSDRFSVDQLDRIRLSTARDAYLTLPQLQEQGIPISYDPVYDEFNIGRIEPRPSAARKVYIDQISAPERGGASVGMEQVRP